MKLPPWKTSFTLSSCFYFHFYVSHVNHLITCFPFQCGYFLQLFCQLIFLFFIFQLWCPFSLPLSLAPKPSTTGQKCVQNTYKIVKYNCRKTTGFTQEAKTGWKNYTFDDLCLLSVGVLDFWSIMTSLICPQFTHSCNRTLFMCCSFLTSLRLLIPSNLLFVKFFLTLYKYTE